MTDATPTPPIPDPAAPAGAAPAAPSASTPYGTPQPYAPQQAYGPRTNVLAIISLVASLAGLFIWIVGPIAGIIMGHIALSQIKRTGEGGRTLALAGTIIGYALAALGLIIIVIYIAFIAYAFNTAGTYNSFVH